MEYGSSGDARMLRLPSARGPNSMRPCIQATILLSVNCSTAVSTISSVVKQVAESQLAVFEHFLGVRGGIGRPQRERPEGHARLLPVDRVPGIQHRADGRPGVARHRLHEHVAVAQGAFQRRNQQGIQSQPAGQAEMARISGQPERRGLHGFLDAGRQVRPHGFRNRRAIGQPQPLIEARAETAGLQALGGEERTVRTRAAVRQVENLEEKFAIAVIAADGKPLDLVLVLVGRKSQQFGDAAVEIAQRIGRVLLLFERHCRAVGLPARAAAEVAAAVEREHRGLAEGRRVVRRRGVRAVVFHQHDAALRELRPQLQ